MSAFPVHVEVGDTVYPMTRIVVTPAGTAAVFGITGGQVVVLARGQVAAADMPHYGRALGELRVDEEVWQVRHRDGNGQPLGCGCGSPLKRSPIQTLLALVEV